MFYIGGISYSFEQILTVAWNTDNFLLSSIYNEIIYSSSSQIPKYYCWDIFRSEALIFVKFLDVFVCSIPIFCSGAIELHITEYENSFGEVLGFSFIG
jgi:hypothetical protein